MATNIPDFTRYLNTSKGTYWQALFVPVLSTTVACFGMICTSCAMVVYGKYIWSPLDIATEWTSPGGRAAAFFVGFSWVRCHQTTYLGLPTDRDLGRRSNWGEYLSERYFLFK